MSGELKLNAVWNLDPLPSINQTSVAYLLVDIEQEGELAASSKRAKSPVTPQRPLNISLVLDTSGSMAGAKLQNLKQAVKWVVDHLSSQDNIAITLFDDEVRPLVSSSPITDAKSMLEKMDSIREAGGTAMSKGLAVGLEEAVKGRSANAVSRIIVLTDGQTWGDADKCKELAAQAGAEGIPITALGVGAEEDWSIELLDTMAAQSGGLSGYIVHPEEISAAFEGTILAMQQTTARNLRLTIKPANEVEIRAVYRVTPAISRLWPGASISNITRETTGPQSHDGGGESSLTLPLGDIQASTGQSLLFEFLLPERKPGQYRLARLLLEYEAAGSKKKVGEAALDIVATFAAGVSRSPGNPRVMNSVEKATTFRLQTRALQASMLGDVAGATRQLRAAATRLLNMGETELAETAEKEAKLLESNGQMSAAGTKKLAFDTRKLGETGE